MPEWIIEVGGEEYLSENSLDEMRDAVQWVLAEEEIARDVELSVVLLGDDEIAALNNQYLSHEGPTDVISFPLPQPGSDRLVGAVCIGYAQAERQAAELGIEFREELLRLAIHGTLHVLGWDHPEEGNRESSPMYLRQEALLTSFLASV